MNLPNNPYVLPVLLGAIVSVFVAVFTWRRRPAAGAMPAVLVMLAVTVWCLGYTFELASPDLPGRIFWSKFEYFGIVSIPLAWFAFALEYTGHERFWSRRNIVLFALVPLLTFSLVWTNESHGLFWSRFELDTRLGFVMSSPTRNIGFFINWIYAYVLLLSSSVLLFRWLVKSAALYRWQSVVLLIATLTPWLGNFLFISGLSPFPRLDLTPLGFAVSSSLLALGLYRYRLFDIVPVAQDKVIANMQDAVLVLDAQNRIVNANPAAHTLLGLDVTKIIGQNAASVFAANNDLIEKFQNVSETHTEITRDTGPGQRWLDLRISSLRVHHPGQLDGRVLVLRDITERKRSEQELERLYTDLQSELAERKRIQAALQELNNELEQRVADRTAELERANQALMTEIEERKKAQEEILRRTDQLEALRQTSLELTSQLDVKSLLASMSQRAVKLMGATTSGFYVYRPKSDLLERVVVAGPYPVNNAPTRRRGEGLVGKVWETNTPIFDNDYNHWAEHDTTYDNAPSRAVIGIPIHWGDRFLGVVTVIADHPRKFTAEDVELLRLFADQAAIALENARLYEQAQQEIAERKRGEIRIQLQLERLQALRTIDQTIISSFDLHLTLDVMLEHVVSLLSVDAAAILLLDEHLQTLEFAAGRGFHSRAIQHTKLRLGEGYAGRAANERHIIYIPNVIEAGGFLARALLLKHESFTAYYGVPLIVKGGVKGVLEIFHRAPLDPDPEWLDFLETLAGQAAIAIDDAQLFAGLERSNAELMLAYDSTIEGWSRAMDLRDNETEGHSQRVAELTVQLARTVGMSNEQIVHTRRGALLHDIGKLGVPDYILRKPGKLTDEEWVTMRKHPQYAYNMLSSIAYLHPALDIPYYHHEKWDGTGYPHGLKGEQIPLAARLFAVVDVWDALQSDRPYRTGWHREKVLEYIRAQAGIHFDPKIVELFLQVISDRAHEHEQGGG